jgi:uridine monophosphate synthetase
VSEAIWQQVGGYLFDMICGVPYTALPIATCISLNQNLPMVMRRKEKKEYGTRQIIEGVYEIGKKCLIVEDIITSGSSILETADDLEVAGLKVKEIAVLISREKQGKANLAAKHYELYAAMTLKEVLTTLFNSNKLNKDEQKIVEHLLQDHSHA